MQKLSTSTALMLIILTIFSFISLDNVHSPLIISEVVSGPISPSAGQFANGIIQNLAPDMSLLDEGWLNFTYLGYLSENIFNISQRLSTSIGTNEYWLLINVTDRSVIDGTSWWVGSYDPWIPTNLDTEVTVTIGLGYLTVQAKEIITVEGTTFETWRLYGELSDSNTTAWYDVNSGHWVKSIQKGPNSVSQWSLVSSNIVVPYEEPISSETTTLTTKSTTPETTTLPEITSTSFTTLVETTSSVIEPVTTSPKTPTTTIEMTTTHTEPITTTAQVITSPGETTAIQSKTITLSVITTVMPEMVSVWPILLIIIGAFGRYRGRLKRG